MQERPRENPGSTDISGHYADLAGALGGYGERVTEPEDMMPAIQRGIGKTQAGTPVLLEFITSQEKAQSRFPPRA
jgi:acetolactate synthase-1/2/3 large subunit